MPQFNGVIGLLDSRSFVTVWYWLVLVGMWSATGRSVLGVPTEVLGRARSDLRAGRGETMAVITLLDWLSLVLPRWRMGPREGVVFLGVTSFGLTVLALMGFLFWLEMAQALFLLLFPFWLLFWMRHALARRLIPLIEDAQEGRASPEETATAAVRRMVRHRTWVLLLSMLAVAVTALWGTLWSLLHPNGL